MRVGTAQEMCSGALGLSQVGFPAGLGESTGKDDKGCILVVTTDWLVLGIYPVAAPPIGSARSGMQAAHFHVTSLFSLTGGTGK